jgi:hypothetical protein
LNRTERNYLNLKLELSLKNRNKRGIANFLGRGLNWLTGNLDDVDKETFLKKI